MQCVAQHQFVVSETNDMWIPCLPAGVCNKVQSHDGNFFHMQIHVSMMTTIVLH